MQPIGIRYIYSNDIHTVLAMIFSFAFTVPGEKVFHGLELVLFVRSPVAPFAL